MNFATKLSNNKFTVCAEVNPPHGTNTLEIINDLKKIKDKVDAFNVTDNSLSRMTMSPLAFSKILLDNGLEPIMHITCRDKNRLAMQSELLGAYALGIRNLLALTGDAISVGNFPDAKAVFDIDSVQLVDLISKLNKSFDLNNKGLSSRTDFLIGAAVNPNTTFVDGQILKMKKKREHGASFFQTQPIFDVDKYKKFINKIKKIKQLQNVKIICGIIILKSVKHAHFLNKKAPGIKIPERIVQDLANAKFPEKRAIEIASNIINEVKPISQGIHFANIDDYSVLAQFLNKL